MVLDKKVNEQKSIDHSVPDIFAIELDNEFSETYDINPKLNSFHREEILKIIEFDYLDLPNIPEVDHNYEVKIKLTSDIPVSLSPRRLSYADRLIVEATIKKLLTAGHIRPSNSPYSFPLVLPPKKNGEKRMCVDYRPLNKIMVRDGYPLPLIDDCLERLEGKRYFSVLDLKNAYHQLEVARECIPYTAFVTPFGQYEYLRLPYGLKIGPSVFQRFMNWVLQSFIEERVVVVYMDDVTIATTTIPEHLDVLKRLLRRFAELRLEVKVEKCHFCYSEIELLGFSVDQYGIRPSNRHLGNIKHFPVPTNTDQVHKCLGLFSYFRRFIPSFSHIAKPLKNLTKPGAKFVFDESCMVAFITLRDKLITPPVLALYNPQKETELHCDASSDGFGGILLQKQTDNKFHPIAYFSQRTTAVESRYHSFELETLAIIYALRKFRVYLEGIPFRIITDCNSLTMTLNKKSINARIARWALELGNYDYTIQHRSGQLMGHVDTLSRYPMVTITNSENSDQIIALVNPDDIDMQLQITQNRDEDIVRIREKLESEPVSHFALEDGLVYRQTDDGHLLLYVPKEMEDHIVRHIHEQTCHMGISKCMDQLRMHYWFPKMHERVERFVKNCVKCLMYSIPPQSYNRTLHHIPKKPIPFDTVHIDHFGPLPSIVSKRKHIFAVVDGFTKHIKLYAVNSTSTKEVCACLDKYFEHYSRPRRVVSDRGTCFTALEFGSYLLDNNIEHVKIATASPQANGQIERGNRILKSLLAKVTEPVQHSDWVKMLTRVEYAINNSVHSVTRQTPCELLFGVNQRGRDVDTLAEYLDDKHFSASDHDLTTMRKRASERIETYQEKSSERYANKHKPAITYKEGDFVMIRNVDTTIGSNKKFIPKYRGPYCIHRVLPNDRYGIRDIENCQVTQLPYDGIVEASRIRLWADWRDSRVLEPDVVGNT